MSDLDPARRVLRRVLRLLSPAGPPLDSSRCYASVEDAIAGTWSCPCGAREGGICPHEDVRDE